MPPRNESDGLRCQSIPRHDRLPGRRIIWNKEQNEIKTGSDCWQWLQGLFKWRVTFHFNRSHETNERIKAGEGIIRLNICRSFHANERMGMAAAFQSGDRFGV